jgi:hypothetical protein
VQIIMFCVAGQLADASMPAGHQRPWPGPGWPDVASRAGCKGAASAARRVFSGGLGCDAIQGGVDDVADEPVVERGVSVREAVVDGAVEEVERDLGVGAGGDFAAFDRAADDRAGLVAAARKRVWRVLASGALMAG